MAVNIEGNQIIFDLDGRTVSPNMMKMCLEYMAKVAARSELALPAKLIAAAAQACDDIIDAEKKEQRRVIADDEERLKKISALRLM